MDAIIFPLLFLGLIVFAFRKSMGMRQQYQVNVVRDRYARLADADDTQRANQCEVDDLNLGACMLSRCRTGKFFGPLDYVFDGYSLRFFDWQFEATSFRAEGWNNLNGLDRPPVMQARSRGFEATLFQTVAAISLDGIKVPRIQIYPEALSSGGVFSFVNRLNVSETRIQTGTILDNGFVVQSDQPDKIRLLFGLPDGRGDLPEVLYDKSWYVEWTGKQLIAFKPNHHLGSHDELDRFADELLVLADLFAYAGDAIEAHLDEVVATARLS